MLVYRICLFRWFSKLTASGYPARWNSKGKHVIYTAGSRALACLENVVHRSGEGLDNYFKVLVIEIPPKIKMTQIKDEELSNEWYKYESYSACQKIGDNWIDNQKTAIIKVPSSIISKEYNYLINPNHEDFKYVKLISVEDFEFDSRIKDKGIGNK